MTLREDFNHALDVAEIHSSVLSKNPRVACELAALMSDISEDRWCAGWLIGLEFILWDEKDPACMALSEKCGGWWAWFEADPDDAHTWGASFVPMGRWIEMVAEHEAPVKP